MLIPQTLLALLALPLLTAAHFKLIYPPARGFDEDILGTGPCGGQSQSDVRTSVSMSSIPVALLMGHDRSVVQMLLGLGNNVGGNFNIVLEQTFQEEGLGDFCLPDVLIPSDLGITEGMNATLQVVTDGEGGGGLYNCADITFTSNTEAVPSSCKNGTGVTATPLPPAQAALNANESTATGGPQNGASASSSATASAATSTPTNEAMMLTATWSVLGAAVMGALALM